MKILLVLSALFNVQWVNAAVIAVIDSGTDVKHSQLSKKLWSNPVDIDDAVDNDDNGLIDDVNGWNFADSNNKLIDKKFLGTFTSDVYKFFEVQTRLIRGLGTDEDRTWMDAARKNQALLSELAVFGNFVHGTHVAGIAARDATQAQIMGLKIIPTKSPISRGQFVGNKAGDPDRLIKMGLTALAAQQGKSLLPIGTYVAQNKARVANCSFGTSTQAAKQILGPMLKLVLRRDATPEELEKYSIFFVAEVVKSASNLVEPSKGKTLFVMAAGNDGMNNDVYPTSPANYKANNVITVAATQGYQRLASFSNYGTAMVEVAAPGVGIESAIPGEQTLMVSGTSQASPFVANVIGRMLDENPALSNSDIRQLLMQTSDIKDFLKEKVMSGGVVNADRAAMAAKLSLTMQLADAISSALVQVNNVIDSSKISSDLGEGFVIPLPSLFQ